MSEGGGDGTEVAAAQRAAHKDPLLGLVVDGRYHFDAVLGEGGMGIVYKATHTALGKPLAIKVLRPEVSKNEQIVARFKQEAQSASSIGNQHIIDVSDFGVMPDGSTYFVMEFLGGRSLTDALEAGRFTSEQVIRIAKQLSGALGAAHEIGIVHRDLKPDNIQLVHRGGQDDFVKILDFGIAKVGGSTSKLTQAGQVFGTPHYMSPEQCAGTTVDQRTDIYALGVILYEMATGHVPFDADNLMGILTKHLYENPIPPHELPPPVNVSPALEAVILRCLAKKPESRYQTMAELFADLEAVELGLTPQAVAEQVELGLMSTQARPDGSGQVTVGFGQPQVPMRRATLPIVAGVLLLVAGAAAAFMVLGSGAPLGEADHVVQPAAPVAPAPAPMPAPKPPAPVAPAPAPEVVAAPVLVTIRSTPPNAELYRNGILLGNTPFALPRPEGAAALTLELKLGGHETTSFSITSATSETLMVSLAPAAPAKAQRKRPAKQPVASEPAEPTEAKGRAKPPRRVQTEVLDPWD